MSQLTIVALILLVAALWKFGPWNRRHRILSYDFPEGWWFHVEIIDPTCRSWSQQRRSRLMDYVRLFVDRVDFIVDEPLKSEFEIKHRVAFATQAFLVFESFKHDPIQHVDKFFVQNTSDDPDQGHGLPRLFWHEKRLNYITFFEVSKAAGSLPPYILGHLEDFLLRPQECEEQARDTIAKAIGMN